MTATICVTIRRVWIHFSGEHPAEPVLQQALAHLPSARVMPTSVKETAEMVAEVRRCIEGGEETTVRTHQSFTEIVKAASEAADQVRAIVQASREQAQGLWSKPVLVCVTLKK